MTIWRKRGRPKLDRPNHDSGTPELQARRSALVGSNDPALAEYPLGIMLARGLICGEEHEAGCYYAMLYAKAVARTNLSCAHVYRRMLAESGRSTALDDKSQEHIERLFRQGKNRLLAAGRRVSEATENLAVFGRPARFLDSRRTAELRRGVDFTEFQAVMEGLAVLVACYGRGAGRRGRMETYRAASLASR
ncbi:MAG TPA: hypothetical protein VGJ31_06510 [Dongiaceae bacterium]